MFGLALFRRKHILFEYRAKLKTILFFVLDIKDLFRYLDHKHACLNGTFNLQKTVMAGNLYIITYIRKDLFPE
jgi:hypothetical protein